MSLKNKIQPDHAPINKYELQILGLPKITFTKVSGMEQEVKKTNMPDMTAVSGGESESFEITAEIPLHHDAEIQAIEDWHDEGKDPVQLTYKKSGTMEYKRASGVTARAYALIGVWIPKLKYPDADMSDSETPAMLEITMSIDDKDEL